MGEGMNLSRSFANLSALALVGLTTLLAGCGSESSSDFAGASDRNAAPPQNGGSAPPGSSGGGTSPGDATRAVEEADVIQVEGALLYAMSKTGGVSIVDISQ